MKTVLIVEDDEERIKWFLEEFDNQVIVNICKTAEKGVRLVRGNKYDLIFLDYDLEYYHYMTDPSKCENTGYTVAQAIPNSVNRKTKVIIHSLNPYGAERMHNVLKETSCVKPFGFFCIQVNPEIKIIEI